MKNLMEKSGIYSWKKETLSTFRYRLNYFFNFEWNLSVPLPFHLKLGIGKKLLSESDTNVEFLDKKYDISNIEQSPFNYLWSLSLALCGNGRELYYERKLVGGPCSKFMSNMPRFRSSVFLSACVKSISILCEIPEIFWIGRRLIEFIRRLEWIRNWFERDRVLFELPRNMEWDILGE